MSATKSNPSGDDSQGSGTSSVSRTVLNVVPYTPQKAIERFTVGPASRAFFKASYGDTPEAWAAKQGADFDETTLMKSMVSRALGNKLGDPKELEPLSEAAKAEWTALGFDDSANTSIIETGDRILAGQAKYFTEDAALHMMSSDNPTADHIGLYAKEAGVKLSEADMAKSVKAFTGIMGMILGAANEDDESGGEELGVDEVMRSLFGGVFSNKSDNSAGMGTKSERAKRSEGDSAAGQSAQGDVGRVIEELSDEENDTAPIETGGETKVSDSGKGSEPVKGGHENA